MTVETLRAARGPHIACATIARAERLALAGAGWSVDQVLRRALDHLEDQYLTSAPAFEGPAFTREEIVAALAGDDLEPPARPPEARQYLAALAAAFDPDPYGRQA